MKILKKIGHGSDRLTGTLKGYRLHRVHGGFLVRRDSSHEFAPLSGPCPSIRAAFRTAQRNLAK